MLLCTLLKLCISNNQLKFECQLYRYQQDTEPIIICFEKKARFMLLFTLVIILVKFFYPICIFVLNINRHFFAFVAYILGQNLYSSVQKRNQNFVYITTICELCILLVYRWLAIRFRLIIRNGNINFRPKPPHAPLNHVFMSCSCLKCNNS